MAFRVAPASNPASTAPPSSIDSILDIVDSSLVSTLEIAGSIEKAAAHFRRSAVPTGEGKLKFTIHDVMNMHFLAF